MVKAPMVKFIPLREVSRVLAIHNPRFWDRTFFRFSDQARGRIANMAIQHHADGTVFVSPLKQTRRRHA